MSKMSISEFWQNFELGTEIDIASNFIYDGLKNFHSMDSLEHESEIFSVLYNLSVGIERFLKVAIILSEFNDSLSIDDFEKSLITHNHLKLLNRLKNNSQKLNLASPHNSFLSLLDKFYKTYRYDRYRMGTVFNLSKEKNDLIDFLKKHKQVEFTESILSEELFYKNTFKTKRFVGNIVKKIVDQLYTIIKQAAHEKNIYTHEIRFLSKAYRLLLEQEFNFSKEEVLWKELLIFILNTDQNSKYLEFIKGIKPLEFDTALLASYLKVLSGDSKAKTEVLEELEALYCDIPSEDRKERLQQLEVIGEDLYFEDDYCDDYDFVEEDENSEVGDRNKVD